ncbi:mRNA cap guanine-N7 methyltransferase-like [Mercenaria mercenaria]|uniref:mRNA cap guanine-N7 methyltransferase-like n=1 Tax=Mercenaria mercenaria TaxID=6596 RepID=UPI00234F1904|nr:mRNA cap guanine-N7 methyltransferase-like [Mercenaria mercenaria]XP_053402079.1 mRNA cap guanine-N7 methyltransferase-like [Mercenaria mercenaria]XP_053402080.1 mRNA cap guanine-N7 methyltransferase-like [Mercenaria mercenaria]
MSQPQSDVRNESQGQQDTEGQGQLVAKHYNELQEAGRDVRTESRIFYMRNFNNWIKSVVIAETLQRLKQERGHDRDIAVLDLCSGKGGDLLKWKRGNIKSIVCADIAGTSVEQSENRYRDMVDRKRFKDRVFSAEFITADCSKARLKDKYKDRDVTFDICSCQFSFHYCFESLTQAEMMLQNAVESLKLGGFFIGTTPNSQELVRRLRDSKDMSFGNEVYRVTFDLDDKTNLPLFGCKYNFHLEGVVDCPEFLVFFPVLEKMAEKHGMKLVYKTPFAEFFNKQVEDREHKNLLGRMQALESYPPEEGGKVMGLEDGDYDHVKSFVEDLQKSQTRDSQRSNRPITVGTLSKAEWEAVTIYCVFMFQKVRDLETGEEWTCATTTDSSRKRPAEEASHTDPPKVSKNT